MNLKIAGWLVDADTPHERFARGEGWPGGRLAEALVTVIDASNAVHTEQRACEVRCAAALESKDVEIERQRSAALRFATALVDYMDGVKDHEIQANTGLSKPECDVIAEVRAAAAKFVRGE